MVLLFRETPLHAGHIEAMAQATRNGAIIVPPVPAFYHRPATVDDLVTPDRRPRARSLRDRDGHPALEGIRFITRKVEGSNPSPATK